ATSHLPAEAQQAVEGGLNVSTQVLLVPAPWSPASLWHSQPCEAPMQLIAPEANPSAGQAPEVPVQVSATSHWPAEARQTVEAGLNVSTQVLLVPAQWSPGSLSHWPPCEAPMQLIAPEANPSAGQADGERARVSAT